MNKQYVRLPVAIRDVHNARFASYRNMSSDAFTLLWALCADPACRQGLSGIFVPNMALLVDFCAVESPAGSARAEEAQVERMLAELVRCDVIQREGRAVYVLGLCEWEGITNGGGSHAAAIREVEGLAGAFPALAAEWMQRHGGATINEGGYHPPGEAGNEAGGEPRQAHDNNAHSKRASSSLRSEEAHAIGVTPPREKGRRAGSAQGMIVPAALVTLAEWMLAEGGFTTPPRGGAAALAKGLWLAANVVEIRSDVLMLAWRWAATHHYWARLRMRGAAWVDGTNFVQLQHDFSAQTDGVPTMPRPAPLVNDDDLEDDPLADSLGGLSLLDVSREREDIA